MLNLDKKTFFDQRQLPKISFYYSYNDQNYEISSDYVISTISDSLEGKILFLLSELNATDDFVVNIYLQDLADECIQSHLRSEIMDEIHEILFIKQENYNFRLGEDDYIAYQDENGRYHIDKGDKKGMYNGWVQFGKITGYLSTLLENHVFDVERIEKPKR